MSRVDSSSFIAASATSSESNTLLALASGSGSGSDSGSDLISSLSPSNNAQSHISRSNPIPSLTIKPTLCLAVGVTGHRLRRLGDIDFDVLRQTVAMLLQKIGAAGHAVKSQHPIYFAAAAPTFRLVTALADGADTIAAEVALESGWQLDACLPFQRDEYANDFSEGEHRADYLRLLARASATFTLVGDRTHANAAYEAIGRLVLDQVDLLIAIWDGDTGHGRGGTSRVVADAIARHIPVVHIDSTGRAAPVLLWSGLADVEIEQVTVDNVPRVLIEIAQERDRAAAGIGAGITTADAAPPAASTEITATSLPSASSAIAAAIAAITMPPENPIDRRMLARFYHERSRKRTPALPYPLLLALTGVRRFGAADWRPQSADACAAQLAQHLASVEQTDPYGQALASKLITRFGAADSAAAYFAQIFRSGFVANFGLAALAVLIALSGPLLPAYKLPLIVIELNVIFIIFANTRAGTRAGWHERWMDDRHLAEQLRSLAMTSALGNLNLRANISGSGGGETLLPGWVHWLARATARELGLPNAIADHAYLSRVQTAAISLVDDQIAYHRANSTRMLMLESRLHHAGQYLFGGTVVACSVWIFCKLAGVPMSFGTIGLTEIVTALTAAMPAVGAAMYGIRMQGDFAGIADRSEATVARLERLRRALKDDPLDYTRLIARLKRLADIMLTDVEHWRTTYQARPLALPG